MKYTVVVYEAEPEEGGYWAMVAELPGCYTQGESIEEVEENVKDAIETYIAALKEAGEPLPEPAVRKLEVAVA
jgi:predicted RNase H-like HicB family nuclease